MSDPTESDGTNHFVHLLYAIPDAGGICDRQISCRLAERLTKDTLAAGLVIESFSRVAGYDGYRIDLRFTPEMGGFVVADLQDAVLVRYVLPGGSLVRLPMTDFSALDYPDVVGTLFPVPW